jgi:hypothetical protein
MSFKDIALPLIERDIPVIPVQPLLKKCLLPNWQGHATTRESMIDLWDKENPDYNVGCVAKPNGIAILDCDVKGLAKRIAKETGQEWPATLVVRSAGKGCFHIYLRQTDRSRALGNRSVAEQFDLQQNDKYVVGPGSKLANGNTYDIMQDEPIADFPDWLADWIEKSAPKHKRAECELAQVVDDFDIEDFLAWYDIAWHLKENWYNCYIECPAAGYQHEQSKAPGFFFDGGDFGFNCWATGCPGHGKSAGWVIKHLNENHAPYPKRIWPEQALDYGALGIDEADLPTEEGDVDDLIPKPLQPVPKVRGKIVITITEKTAAGTVIAEQSQPTESLATALSEQPVSTPTENVAVKPTDIHNMPEDCMYGWLGEKTKELGVPYGFGYPAMLAMAGVRTLSPPKMIRPTMYVALIGPIHSGKSQAMRRAQDAFEWANTDTILRGTPGSDRGLAKMLEDDTLQVQSRLLLQDELRKTLSKMDIQGSCLATTLCELWSEDKAGSADKKGFDSILCRLSIVGGLMAENPQEFAEVFGKESNAGLYDRFIFGLAPKWKYTIPSFRSENRMPYPGTPEVPEYVYDMAHAWRDMIENGRERLAEIALRVALVTTGMNHDKTITRECMQAALNFMTWQEAIREHFRPSRAEPTIEAKVTEVIERAVSSMVDGEGRSKWVSWRRVYKNRNLSRYGRVVVNRVYKAMVDAGDLIEERVVDEDDDSGKKTKVSGRVCWRAD